jgi:GNAT superfamily N-acetyltransferase
MRRDDIAAGLRLCRASHWNQLARDWELFLTLSPEGCRVAVDNAGAVIGSVATIRYGRAFSWVAMVLVDPAHRGAGIGTALLQESLVILADMPIVRLDATPDGFRVYDPAGFREEYWLLRMQRTAQPLHGSAAKAVLGAAGRDSDTHVRAMRDGDLAAVLGWDREAFGADRRPLLDAFRRGATEYAWVVGQPQIDGYLFGRHGHTFEQLGPLVARDEATARRLVAAGLSTYPDRPFILDVPQRASWVSWLASLQFTVQRPFIRMYRGDARPRERMEEMFAIAGPEFG